MNTAFAAEAKSAVGKSTPLQRVLMKKFGKKLYLDHERREGWRGELAFYLFWCDECGNYAKDYAHGHIELQYLSCSHCGAHHYFVPWWVGFVALWYMFRFLCDMVSRKKR